MAKVSKIAGQIAQWSNKPTNEMSELGVQRNFWLSNIDILVDFSILFSILYSRLVRFVISMNSTIVYIYFTLRERANLLKMLFYFHLKIGAKETILVNLIRELE